MKNFNYLLIITFLIFYSFKLFSQNTISVGFSSTLNNSNINFYNNFFPQNLRTDPFSSENFSFIAELKNTKSTGIRIETSSILKGWKENFNSQILINNYRYLNIPVMMTTYFGERALKVNFSVGPYVDFLLNNNSLSISDSYPDKEILFDSNRDNDFGYGLKASSGFSLDYKKHTFLFLVSYLYNFDNLIDVEDKTISIPDISNFRTLQLSLVYLFNFSKDEI